MTQLRAWPDYRAARHILSYAAFGSEFDLQALHEDEGKTFYLTRTPEARGAALTVHRWAGELEPHPYGYLQPKADAAEVDPHTIDLILVPGLCFDLSGTRLGYGKGYYDRLLPRLRPQALRVGVTTTDLVVPRLPRDGFDVPMTHLVTECAFSAVKKSSAADL